MAAAVILVGDVRERLKDLKDGSVHCVITSPPYWGLRDYGHEGQIGLEQSPDAYVAEMVTIFREIKRVLRDDGTAWLNLGDSYAGSINGSAGNLKSKDLVGIPWRVAFALQADGWYLRQDIIWHKPNVMPESVTDRCTKSHEYVFLLTKSARYFFDNEAIKEPVSEVSIERSKHSFKTDRPSAKTSEGGIDVEEMGTRFVDPSGRNKRSVWTIPPASFKGAHFAVMPERLVEPSLLAGTSEAGCCADCGAFYRRTKDSKMEWQQTCECATNERARCVVLDPFNGSGTTGVVALKHNRNYVGCELNREYVDIAYARLSDEAPMFNTVSISEKGNHDGINP